jgi:hypothetical protein
MGVGGRGHFFETDFGKKEKKKPSYLMVVALNMTAKIWCPPRYALQGISDVKPALGMLASQPQ